MLFCHRLDGIVREVTAIGTREDFIDTGSWLMLLLAVYEDVFIVVREKGAESLCSLVSGTPTSAGPSLTYLCFENCAICASPKVTLLANVSSACGGSFILPVQTKNLHGSIIRKRIVGMEKLGAISRVGGKRGSTHEQSKSPRGGQECAKKAVRNNYGGGASCVMGFTGVNTRGVNRKPRYHCNALGRPAFCAAPEKAPKVCCKKCRVPNGVSSTGCTCTVRVIGTYYSFRSCSMTWRR